MKTFAKWITLGLSAALAATTMPTFAHANLGGSEGSIEVVRLALHPTAENVTSRTTHTVHEFQVGEGLVRAYIAPSGQVFAYTAHGLRTQPDPALFGAYLGEFQAAARAFRAKGRRPLSLSTPNLTAAISGPQGLLHWSISLKALPPGVTLDDVQ